MAGIGKEQLNDQKPKRSFDLTLGPTLIDCDNHCPAKILNEEYPHFTYVKGKYTDFERGPYCDHPQAPLSYESKPRNPISRMLTGKPGRICEYWNGLNESTHSPKKT